jgi:hypothetical protein
MSVGKFTLYYMQLSDDDLALVIDDRKDLVPEAAEALDRVLQCRKVGPRPQANWKPDPMTGEPVKCLENYEAYRRVRGKRANPGKWYLFALAPFVIGMAFGRKAFENSAPFVLLTLAWGVSVAIYGLALNFRFLAYRCPQCGERFGRGAECINCGFPRTAGERI